MANAINWIKEYRRRTGCSLKEAKDAYDAGREMPGDSPWKPIDTAPRDGDNILATDARIDGGFPQVVFWSDAGHAGWHQTDAEIVYHPEFFTHWRRDCLPPPPHKET